MYWEQSEQGFCLSSRFSASQFADLTSIPELITLRLHLAAALDPTYCQEFSTLVFAVDFDLGLDMFLSQ
jgi:hypothetical protein